MLQGAPSGVVSRRCEIEERAADTESAIEDFRDCQIRRIPLGRSYENPVPLGRDRQICSRGSNLHFRTHIFGVWCAGHSPRQRSAGNRPVSAPRVASQTKVATSWILSGRDFDPYVAGAVSALSDTEWRDFRRARRGLIENDSHGLNPQRLGPDGPTSTSRSLHYPRIPAVAPGHSLIFIPVQLLAQKPILAVSGVFSGRHVDRRDKKQDGNDQSRGRAQQGRSYRRS